MKNIYLVVTIAIAVVLILLGTAILLVEFKGGRNAQTDSLDQKTQEAGGQAGEAQEISKEEYERQAIFERPREGTAPASTAPVIEIPE
ncbi:hypothetical protein A3D07_03755 [Candidatus Curtissbacteria bacterium RIFCSPHIGHO2_02_FULL_42_15]|uniref:Uncharacterized protein n=1 Tax=Candidatus Curtissbacteria bacterium RIFCSPHIGHO2_02_FULL_42_15 TaxID=1797716 RepID=A0A1F5GJE2_9BACT|nr:MAG: hypothetical protein A3D07_03755 [Candidatus Curtissbacteria bacterium RIFCSPHIGHO2_02_FULL_42_15]